MEYQHRWAGFTLAGALIFLTLCGCLGCLSNIATSEDESWENESPPLPLPSSYISLAQCAQLWADYEACNREAGKRLIPMIYPPERYHNHGPSCEQPPLREAIKKV